MSDLAGTLELFAWVARKISEDPERIERARETGRWCILNPGAGRGQCPDVVNDVHRALTHTHRRFSRSGCLCQYREYSDDSGARNIHEVESILRSLDSELEYYGYTSTGIVEAR